MAESSFFSLDANRVEIDVGAIKTIADQASLAAEDAQSAVALASSLANAPEDEEVLPGVFSAKHYAAKAAKVEAVVVNDVDVVYVDESGDRWLTEADLFKTLIVRSAGAVTIKIPDNLGSSAKERIVKIVRGNGAGTVTLAEGTPSGPGATPVVHGGQLLMNHRDFVGGGTYWMPNPLTVSYTVPDTDTDRALVALMIAQPSNTTFTNYAWNTPTFGGQVMTAVGAGSGGRQRQPAVGIYMLKDPPTGAGSLVFSPDNSLNWRGYAFYLAVVSGLDMETPFEGATFDVTQGERASNSVSVTTSGANRLLLGAAVARGYAGSPGTLSAGSTLSTGFTRDNDNFNNFTWLFANRSAPSAGAYANTVTWAASQETSGVWAAARPKVNTGGLTLIAAGNRKTITEQGGVALVSLLDTNVALVQGL